MKIPAIKTREKWKNKKTVNPNSLHKEAKKSTARVDAEMKRNVKIFMLAPASTIIPFPTRSHTKGDAEWMKEALNFYRNNNKNESWDFCLSKKIQELPEKSF